MRKGKLKEMNSILSILAQRMFSSLPQDAQKFVLYLMVAEDMAQFTPQIIDNGGNVRELGSIAALRKFDPNRDINDLAEELRDAWKKEHGEPWTWIKLSVDQQGHFEAEPHYEEIELLEDVVPT